MTYNSIIEPTLHLAVLRFYMCYVSFSSRSTIDVISFKGVIPCDDRFFKVFLHFLGRNEKIQSFQIFTIYLLHLKLYV